MNDDATMCPQCLGRVVKPRARPSMQFWILVAVVVTAAMGWVFAETMLTW
ncbi:MAG: hypothetical protein ABJE47_16520 [bacterium]